MKRSSILVLKSYARKYGLHPKGVGNPLTGRSLFWMCWRNTTQIRFVFSKVHSNYRMENGVLVHGAFSLFVSSLTLHQNLTIGSLWNVSYNLESEIISMTFIPSNINVHWNMNGKRPRPNTYWYTQTQVYQKVYLIWRIQICSPSDRVWKAISLFGRAVRIAPEGLLVCVDALYALLVCVRHK